MNKLRLILYKLNLLKKKRIHKSYRYLENFNYKYPFGRTLLTHEQQYYSDSNVYEIDSGYEFVVKKEHINTKPQWNKEPIDFKYISGMLWSKEQFKYGSFEIEAFIPNGHGLWSAFWLHGQNKERFTEIDIFEYYGDKKKFTYNTHFGAGYKHDLGGSADGIKLPNLENSWHKYRLGWYVEKDLKFYIDDKLVGVRDGKYFNMPMNLIINCAVEKNIGNKLDKDLPTIMQVKNIKYYGLHK